MSDVDNAVVALAHLVGTGVTVRLRYEHPARPGMATHHEGEIAVVRRKDNDVEVEMEPVEVVGVPRTTRFRLSDIEAIEIRGGLREALRARERAPDMVDVGGYPVDISDMDDDPDDPGAYPVEASQ